MDVNLERYEKTREILVHYDCLESKLDKLKNEFKEDINSQRVFERISSLKYLIKILEKRDALGPKYINKLIQIVQEVAPGDIQIRNILFQRDDDNMGRNEFSGPSSGNNGIRKGRVLPPSPPNIVRKINEMIQSNIGYKWKELARALSIQEGQIDDLEYRYRFEGIYEMIGEVLVLHQERCGSNFERWRSELQAALDRARRRDLVEDIDEMLKFNV